MGQVGASAETLPTFPTTIGPFPSVDVLVLPLVGAVAETLLTFQA
ncbi:hypothetical protein Nmel_003092, partial [Mimus melanotis]